MGWILWFIVLLMTEATTYFGFEWAKIDSGDVPEHFPWFIMMIVATIWTLLSTIFYTLPSL